MRSPGDSSDIFYNGALFALCDCQMVAVEYVNRFFVLALWSESMYNPDLIVYRNVCENTLSLCESLSVCLCVCERVWLCLSVCMGLCFSMSVCVGGCAIVAYGKWWWDDFARVEVLSRISNQVFDWVGVVGWMGELVEIRERMAKYWVKSWMKYIGFRFAYL